MWFLPDFWFDVAIWSVELILKSLQKLTTIFLCKLKKTKQKGTTSCFQ